MHYIYIIKHIARSVSRLRVLVRALRMSSLSRLYIPIYTHTHCIGCCESELNESREREVKKEATLRVRKTRGSHCVNGCCCCCGWEGVARTHFYKHRKALYGEAGLIPLPLSSPKAFHTRDDWFIREPRFAVDRPMRSFFFFFCENVVYVYVFVCWELL